MPYKNGKKEGVSYEYNEDGSLRIQAEYKNNQKHGRIIYKYSQPEDILTGTEEQVWKKGKLVHIYSFFEDGQLRYSQEYPSGKYEEYRRDGKLKFVQMMKDSVMHGNFMDYTHTFQDGVSIEYCYDGKQKKVEENYKKGKRNGKSLEYYCCYEAKCKPVVSVSKYYKKGKLHGDYVEFFRTGKIASKSKYENGILVGTKKCSDGRQGNEKLDCFSSEN